MLNRTGYPLLHALVTIGNTGTMNMRVLSDSAEYLATPNMTHTIYTGLGSDLFGFGPSIIICGFK